MGGVCGLVAVVLVFVTFVLFSSFWLSCFPGSVHSTFLHLPPSLCLFCFVSSACEWFFSSVFPVYFVVFLLLSLLVVFSSFSLSSSFFFPFSPPPCFAPGCAVVLFSRCCPVRVFLAHWIHVPDALLLFVFAVLLSTSCPTVLPAASTPPVVLCRFVRTWG